MKIEIELNISKQLCEDIAITAIESNAIQYWADVFTWDQKKAEATFKEQENPEAKTYTLNQELITKGIENSLKGKPKISNYIKDYIFKAAAEDDASYVDIEVADVIVQMAVFGELVYA